MEEDGGELLKAETSQWNKRSRNAASLCLKMSVRRVNRLGGLILSCSLLCFHLCHFPSFIELMTWEDGCSTAGWLRSRSPGRQRRPHPRLASSPLTCWGLDSAGVPLSIDYTFVSIMSPRSSKPPELRGQTLLSLFTCSCLSSQGYYSEVN